MKIKHGIHLLQLINAEVLDKIVKILCLNKYKDGLINRRTAEAEMFFGE